MKGHVRSVVLLMILGVFAVGCGQTQRSEEGIGESIPQAVGAESEPSPELSAADTDPCRAWQESPGTIVVIASLVGEEEEGRREIAAILEDGTRCRLMELTSPYAVRISPQHDMLAWFAGGDINNIHLGTHEIRVLEPAGGALEGSQTITFSPDGSLLAIVQQEWEMKWKENEMPSPKEIWHFVLMNLETAEQRILYHGPVSAYPFAMSENIAPRYLRIVSLGWSEATDEILLAVYHWMPMATDVLRDVYAVDVETGEARLVMAVEEGALGVFEDLPRMSPDGRWLAYIMPADGRTIEMRSISKGEVGSIQIPDEIGSARPGFLQWLPDSQQMSFLAEDWQGKNRYAGHALVDMASGQVARLEAVDGDIQRWCSADVLVYAEGQTLQRMDLQRLERVLIGDLSTGWIVDCWVNE